MMAERGVVVTYETIRDWSHQFGGTYAKRLRSRTPRPGDRWHLDEVYLSINGKPLAEPYVIHVDPMVWPAKPQLPEQFRVRDQFGPYSVPAGQYFAMGDNRDSSLDSRYWGFVPRDNIIGKPLVIYWSYDASTEELSNPAVSINHLFDIATHFVTKTRWSRT